MATEVNKLQRTGSILCANKLNTLNKQETLLENTQTTKTDSRKNKKTKPKWA